MLKSHCMSGTKKKVSVFWFRRDLRDRDNHGLFKALKSGNAVLPIFIFDKNILEKLEDEDDARVTFIFDQINQINSAWGKAFNSSIQIFSDRPEKVFKELTHQYDIEAVYANEDYEPEALKRDQSIKEQLSKKSIEFFLFKDQVIFSPTECLKDDQTPYLVHTPYKKKWKKIFRKSMLSSYESQKLLKSLIKISPTKIKNLKSIGFIRSKLPMPTKSVSKSMLKNYKENRDFPALDGTSKLGVHLRFGTISVREVMKVALTHSSTWLDELIWREFFMAILFHFPKSVIQPFKPQYAGVKWRKSEVDFKKWCEGKTGYPIVDAGMRELVETGYMHNRVRMITASFLCKHLLLPWTWGERFFARHLLDFELSSNVGNWQWVAGCGVDAAPYFRVFNPTTQAKKFDPDGEYVKRWVLEFGSKDYVEPMVDHEFARRRALKIYKDGLEKK